MKYAVTSAIYIFGVIMGLTVLVLLLINLVPMAVSGAVGDAPADVLQRDTAATVLQYAALLCAGLWLTANIQHFAFVKIRGLVSSGKRQEQKKSAPEKQKAQQKPAEAESV